MIKNNELLQIPYGTRDFLPKEAAYKRSIESALANIFNRWGYDEVVTPSIEFLDTLTMADDGQAEPSLFKFIDRNNRTLALRHEMTTPLARVASSRLKDAEFPLKLSYITNVCRYEQAQMGRQCEFYQGGVELMGVSGAGADAEVIALAVQALKEAGLENFQVSLGQVDFINGIMEQAQLSAEERHAIKTAMVKHDLVGLENILNESKMADRLKEVLVKAPLLNGKDDMLKRAYAMVCNNQSKRALDNLMEIYELLKAYGVADYVTFDLGLIRDFDYYTGMVFEAYTAGLGFPLCGGGRYDNLLSAFGAPCPATGFALGVERIMLALERQGAAKPSKRRDAYVAYGTGGVVAAVKKARELRGEGRVVELALESAPRDTAERYCRAKGYAAFVYVE
jgi:ATP phosphoribosyltransferase regulatory subunit